MTAGSDCNMKAGQDTAYAIKKWPEGAEVCLSTENWQRSSPQCNSIVFESVLLGAGSCAHGIVCDCSLESLRRLRNGSRVVYIVFACAFGELHLRALGWLVRVGGSSMANVLHVAKLREGAAAWNSWRADNPGLIPDLRGLTLSLSQRQMGPAQGGPINLRDAQLGGADLRFATLTGADLSNAGLAAADLGEALLQNANFSGADLTGALLDKANLEGACLEGSNICAASFDQTAGLSREQLEKALGDKTTVLPDGMPFPDTWVVSESSAKSGPAATNISSTNVHKAPDLYTFIGVPRSADEKAIRDAYRATAKSFHPDRRPGDRNAEEAFKVVTAAADILLDERRRALYDEGVIDVYGVPMLRPASQTQTRTGTAVLGAVVVISALLVGAGGIVFMKASPRPDLAFQQPSPSAPLVPEPVPDSGPSKVAAATSPASDDAMKAAPQEKAAEAGPEKQPVIQPSSPPLRLADAREEPQLPAETASSSPIPVAAEESSQPASERPAAIAPPPVLPLLPVPPASSHPMKSYAIAHAIRKREGTATPAKGNTNTLGPLAATRPPAAPLRTASISKPAEDGVTYHEVSIEGWPGGCVVKMTLACRQNKAWCGC